MPVYSMRQQIGESCAAHCTAIAIAELTATKVPLDPAHVEAAVWNAIKFLPGTDRVTKLLASKKYSDPRKVVEYINSKQPSIEAELLMDDQGKSDVYAEIDQYSQNSVGGMVTMLGSSYRKEKINIEEGVYYNCVYADFNGSVPTVAGFNMFHNILVTKSGGVINIYNSNESTPSWVPLPGGQWRRLENQNGGKRSYVFSGLAVVMKRKESGRFPFCNIL